jgi:hypothetical protein
MAPEAPARRTGPITHTQQKSKPYMTHHARARRLCLERASAAPRGAQGGTRERERRGRVHGVHGSWVHEQPQPQAGAAVRRTQRRQM